MDITLQIHITQAVHALKTPESTAARPMYGDIFAVHMSVDIATLTNGKYVNKGGIGNNAFGFIHLLNVPDTLNLFMLDQESGETLDRVYTDPDTGVTTTSQVPDSWRQRTYGVPLSVMPVAMKDEMITARESTVDWSTFRGAIRRKISFSRNDSLLDDISNAVTDAELI